MITPNEYFGKWYFEKYKRDDPADLAEGAARLAIEELASNWYQALHDGYKLEQLLNDVDDVIEHLKKFKSEAQKTLQEATNE